MSETKSYVKLMIKKGVSGGTGFESEICIAEGTSQETIKNLIDMTNECKDYLIDNVKL